MGKGWLWLAKQKDLVSVLSRLSLREFLGVFLRKVGTAQEMDHWEEMGLEMGQGTGHREMDHREMGRQERDLLGTSHHRQVPGQRGRRKHQWQGVWPRGRLC